LSISPAELAALPTAPTVSAALDDAARYADDGAILALSRAVYGSTNPADYAAVVSPEHTLAWATGIIATARIIDPAISSDLPDGSWDEDRFGGVVLEAHQLLTGWAEARPSEELADLFRTAARDVRDHEK
jgi:hypothetical protein